MPQYAFITGASRGIGKAAAMLFSSHGFHIFLNCKNSIDKIRQVEWDICANGGSCQVLMGDVGCPGDVQTMFEQIDANCDGLDILVNNAGISHIGLLSDMKDSEWQKIIQTNLSSVFYCSRAAIPAMIRKKSGRIINISSMWGTEGASCETAYSASKAGVHGLTKALAKELAPSNIQVNAVAFGVIDTDMNRQLDKDELTALEQDIPAGRFATSHEAAEMIWNISTSPAYMTGQIIGCDGGF